jgi:branched-chain amino acid transport system permease protein
MVGALVRGLGIAEAREEAQAKLSLLGLAGVANQSPRKLPTGHLKLLDLARVLLLRPKLVLLDELMAGLSIGELETVLGAIELLSSEGVSFLVIEHLMEVINRLSRHLIVMDAGRVVTEGMPADVICDPHVIAAYLGEEALEHGVA